MDSRRDRTRSNRHGAARVLYFDTQYSDVFAPMHEDAHEDAVPLELPGIDRARLDVRLLTPTDLAISKLGRFSDVDRRDVEALAREGLLETATFQPRAVAALKGFVGDASQLQASITLACRLIEAHSPRRR